MSDDRVQDALAAHLEHLEVGGPAPDTSNLTSDELDQLNALIEVLAGSDKVAFGRALDESHVEDASTDEGRQVLRALHEALPGAARIASDPSAPQVAPMDIVEGWIVGTFGGRIRVWLLRGDDALEGSDRWLRDLERVFRLYPETVAIGLVTSDLSCLLVQPEDCAPTIEVPRGSLVGRRYRRPVHPVGEALPAFVRELVPYWEPMREISGEPNRMADVAPIVGERAAAAIEEQAGAGKRSRTAAKKDALTALGDAQVEAIVKLTMDVHEGRSSADDVEEALRKLATKR